MYLIAVALLLGSLHSGKEREQRAAAYGLSVGGDAVIPGLLTEIRSVFNGRILINY